jgi:hypothetical protein
MNTNPTSPDVSGADTLVAPSSSVTTYRLIRKARAPKMGPHSTGQIVYQILTDETQQELFIRLAANEGGGYISDEAVSLHAIVRCVTDLEDGQVLRSGAFKPAFIGRSSNNSGFIAAVLLAEGLLSRIADRPHGLSDNGQWQAWCATQLAVVGDLPCVRVGKEVIAAEASGSAVQPDVDPGLDAAGSVAPDHVPVDVDVPSESESGHHGRKGRKGRLAEHA